MAGIFDDLRDKGNGILSSLNDFLYNSKSTLPTDTTTDPDTSGLNYQRGLPLDPTDKTAGQYGGMFDKRQEFYPAGESTPSMTINNKPYVNPNAKTPKPKDPAENTFLGAVGEYFNNAQKTWKDKGGFDALMSNPQFGIGLSLLQQASEGKTIGSSALKAMVDGGVISDAYAKKIAARSKVLAPITEDQRAEAEAALSKMNVGKPDFLDKLFNFRTNQPALYREALTKIAERADKDAKLKSKEKGGQEVRPDYDKAILDLTDSGELNFRTEQFLGGRAGTVTAQPSKAELKLRGIKDTSNIPASRQRRLGGPVTQGKAYLVGEVGPEVFIPKETGKIVSTDDSKIINLLLESNPQLKSVSPARAEKILRNRFPDYFE
jgi:hypothetical protein